MILFIIIWKTERGRMSLSFVSLPKCTSSQSWVRVKPRAGLGLELRHFDKEWGSPRLCLTQHTNGKPRTRGGPFLSLLVGEGAPFAALGSFLLFIVPSPGQPEQGPRGRRESRERSWGHPGSYRLPPESSFSMDSLSLTSRRELVCFPSPSSGAARPWLLGLAPPSPSALTQQPGWVDQPAPASPSRVGCLSSWVRALSTHTCGPGAPLPTCSWTLACFLIPTP